MPAERSSLECATIPPAAPGAPAAPPGRRRLRPRLASALAGLLALPAAAAPPGPPRISPPAAVRQTVGIADLTVEYSRPSVRGRTIWGGLVPWGEVWRAGANEATTLTLTHDATIEGQPLAAGRYSLFAIPRQASWTFVFHRDPEQWGAFDYDPEGDALRVDVEPRAAAFQEQLLFVVDEVTDEQAVVALHWENLRVALRVAFDTPTLALARAREEAERDGQAAYRWAQYFLQKGLHLDVALELAARAAAESTDYWTLATHARLLQSSGRTDEARLEAARALQAAEEVDDGFADLVRQDAVKLRDEMTSWGG